MAFKELGFVGFYQEWRISGAYLEYPCGRHAVNLNSALYAEKNHYSTEREVLRDLTIFCYSAMPFQPRTIRDFQPNKTNNNEWRVRRDVNHVDWKAYWPGFAGKTRQPSFRGRGTPVQIRRRCCWESGRSIASTPLSSICEDNCASGVCLTTASEVSHNFRSVSQKVQKCLTKDSEAFLTTALEVCLAAASEVCLTTVSEVSLTTDPGTCLTKDSEGCLTKDSTRRSVSHNSFRSVSHDSPFLLPSVA